MVVQGNSGGHVPLVNMATRTAGGHRSTVTTVAWNADGSKLLAGGDSSTVRAYETDRLAMRDLLAERESVAFTGHTMQIEHVVSAPGDRDLFATTGRDCAIKLYDFRSKSRKPSYSVPLGQRDGVSMVWSPDGKWIVVGDSEDVVYIVNAEKGEVSRTIKREGQVNQMRWSESGDLMFLALGDGRVEVAAWPSMRLLRHLLGHRARCLCIAVDPFGRRLAVSSADTLVTVWNAKTLDCEFTIDRATDIVACMDYSHDGRYLATACGSTTGGIEISGADGSRVVFIPTTGPVRDMKWHPKRLLLAFCVTGDRSTPRPPAPRSMYPGVPVPTPPQAKVYVYGFMPLITPGSRNR